MLFIPLIPHTEIEDHTGKQPAFRHTQEKPSDEEASEILGDA